MPKSDDIIAEIKAAKERLAAAETSLKEPRAPIILGPMDYITPWTEDATDVKWKKDKIDKLTLELGRQVLRERG